MYHRAKENQRREEEEDALLAAAEEALAAEPELEKEIHVCDVDLKHGASERDVHNACCCATWR